MKERHYPLSNRFDVKMFRHAGRPVRIEWMVYPKGHPYGPYIASGEANSLNSALAQASRSTAYAVRRMRQTKDTGQRYFSKRPRRDAPASVSYEVDGPSARSATLRFRRPEQAIYEASSRIYTSEASRERALSNLKQGRNAHFHYGFSEVTIHVRRGR